MGSAVSRVTNTAIRPFKEYNLHERAHKAVKKNKYVPSPKHPSTQEFIQKSINELPTEVKENLSSTDSSLNERLRQVYVTSQDITPLQPPPRQHPDRPLPLDRGSYVASEYGFVEPKVVPYGKVTLKNALQFITSHQNDSAINNANSIAREHKLDQRLTEQVLRHFGTFRLFMPPQPTEQQLKMLKQVNATAAALPNTVDLKRRLQGVAMSNVAHATLPMHQFPEPAPKPVDSTLMQPSPPDPTLRTSDDGVVDEGMDKYVVQAPAVPLEDGAKDGVESSSSESVKTNKDGISRQSAEDVKQANSFVPIAKDKNVDAT